MLIKLKVFETSNKCATLGVEPLVTFTIYCRLWIVDYRL